MKLQKYLEENLLYFSLLTFIFVSSASLAISTQTPIKTTGVIETVFGKRDLPDIPALTETATFPLISAQSVLAIDIDSGITLYEKDPDKILLPASTTKIMTALVAADYYKNDDVLTVNGERIDGQKMGLVRGELITAKDLLYGLLIYSANDAAEVLAANFPGGREAFVYAMNEKARELSLNNTHFVNPSGLEDLGHISTSRDLARLATRVMESPRLAEIVATKTYNATSIDGVIVHRLTNINELIGKVDGVLGVKTGWTENARENLITFVVRDGRRVMIALLGSQDRFGESEELIEWIYSNYVWQEVSLL